MSIILNGKSFTDTVATTGDATVGDGSGAKTLYIDGGAGNQRTAQMLSGGSLRWRLGANTTAEGGSDAGSDFLLSRYSDAGGWLANAIQVDRSDGTVTIDKDLKIADGSESDARIYIACDTAGTGTLEFRPDAQTAAEFQVKADDDLVWRRYNPKGTYQDEGLLFDSSTGDIATVQWSNYYSSSTVVGFSSMTNSIINYKRFGKLVFVQVNLGGTSDTTTLTFTLPYATRSDEIMVHPIKYINAGTWGTTPGSVQLGTSDSSVTAYTDMDTAAWSDTGTKGIQGNFWYEAA
jgi:hypothetical protein